MHLRANGDIKNTDVFCFRWIASTLLLAAHLEERCLINQISIPCIVTSSQALCKIAVGTRKILAS
jgi:hypothetical protein